MKRPIILFILLLALAAVIAAQAPTATLVGVVKDSTGALVPATRLTACGTVRAHTGSASSAAAMRR